MRDLCKALQDQHEAEQSSRLSFLIDNTKFLLHICMYVSWSQVDDKVKRNRGAGSSVACRAPPYDFPIETGCA